MWLNTTRMQFEILHIISNPFHYLLSIVYRRRCLKVVWYFFGSCSVEMIEQLVFIFRLFFTNGWAQAGNEAIEINNNLPAS
jgi:hypothetical protein